MYLVVPPELQQWARARGIAEPPLAAETSGQADSNARNVPRLVLTSPSRGSVLQLASEVPLDLQRLEVAAALSGATGVSRVLLSVDGVQMATLGAPPYRTTWQLAAGRHLFRAEVVDPEGRSIASDEVAVTVRADGQ